MERQCEYIKYAKPYTSYLWCDLYSYVSSKDAAKDKLAFINDAGNAIMRVDNTTQVSVPNKRNSIRITTKDHYTVGSVWVADMLHVPYGVRYFILLTRTKS